MVPESILPQRHISGLPTLRRVVGGQLSILQADCLVGRAARCDLQIDEAYVSGEHAVVRWNGKDWEVRDLNSRNGTLLDGERLVGGQAHVIQKDTKISFGHPDETWLFANDAPPQVMAVSVDDAETLLLEGDVMAIPSGDSPEATIMRGPHGSWLLENSAGDVLPLENRDVFVVRERAWRFCCPQALAQTAVVEQAPSLRSSRLTFNVSMDEEHVEVLLESGGAAFKLGARTHNYLLLTLARYRMQDAANGTWDAACGWVYLDDLLKALVTSSNQLNVDIHRIRKQFGVLGLADAASIVERRSRTGQIRIGVADLIVARS
ncbi:MAG TPA: FHA domain-containing protein [Polyangiaceae bacterium]|nr:FHA domain-containing protein [Polyangiaceae bacterium]